MKPYKDLPGPSCHRKIKLMLGSVYLLKSVGIQLVETQEDFDNIPVPTI